MVSLSSLTPRAYLDESDLAQIANLIDTCAIVDELEIQTSVNELRQQFSEPGFNLAQDLRLWCDRENNLLGFGRLWISQSSPFTEDSGHLGFRVHPTARHADLEAQILAWALQRMQAVGEERQTQTKLRVGVRESEQDRVALLQQNEFMVERYFYRMARSLLQPIPMPQFPPGFNIRPIEGDHEGEAWVEMFNQTFIDHWDFHPMTVEKWLYYGREPNYRFENDLVAVDPTGTLAAFCYCEIDPAHNDRTGRNEGWIRTLGTRRGFRGQGLGRAMLLAALHRLQESGVETALLGVDADNPSGALRLYQSVGFTQQATRTLFAKWA